MPDPRDHHDDPDAPPTEEELAESRSLREALEDPASPAATGSGRAGEDAQLARSLASAWSPRDLTKDEHRVLVEKALDRHDGLRQRRARVVRVSFGAGAIIALAASVLLVVRGDRQPPETVRAVAGLAVSRSTQPLFPDRFAPTGGESSRIDRIAMARGADLRDNEFAKWGVR
jgi:hypothetical protein